jgi:RNA polymerase sigma-70 factor, ECF subfamily
MAMLRAAASLPKPVRRGRNESVDETDAALMRRVAAADRSAMHTLFSRHHLAIYRFVLVHLQDKVLAEDVTSEVFLDVWRHAARFQGQSAVLTWILSIARGKTFGTGPKPGNRLDRDAAGERTGEPDAPLQVQDRNTVLRKCIKRLPAEHREVIDLVYYQEQSVESVAAILGIPCSTARSRVFYARKRLADELKKSGVDWIGR